jgi:hypothetical protein
MKKEYKKSMISTFILMLVMGVSACATSGSNLVKTGAVNLEIIPSTSRNIFISKANIYFDDGDTVITGRVKRKSTVYESGGHVDIAVVGPEGKVIEHISTGYVPNIIRRKGARESHFTVRLPIDLPEKSIVRVGYHPSTRSTGLTFRCGQNIAVPG